jgi:hypothetical protein
MRASAESRCESQMAEFELLADTFMAEDDNTHIALEDIADRLKTEAALPDDFSVTLITNQYLFIYLLSHTDGIPRITTSISVKSDLSVVTSLGGKLIPAGCIKYLVDGQLTKMSQLVNLTARVKSLGDERGTRPFYVWVQMAKQCLKSGLETIDDEQEECRVVQFLVAQLKLLTTNKFGRHYSRQLTVLCYMTYASSAAAYSVLRGENILCLPSVNTLKKVTRRLSISDGLDNASYLSLRMSSLNEYERNVVLMIDEICIAKRVEYCAGNVQGLTDDGSVASTLLFYGEVGCQ